MQQVVLPFDFLGSDEELVQPERLHEVVDGVHLEAFDRILRIGGREDDQRRVGERLHEVHPAQVRHVDVGEDGVDGLVGEDFPGLQRARAGGDPFQEVGFRDVGFQLAEGQRFVVDGKAAYHVFSVWVAMAPTVSGRNKSMVKTPSSCPEARRYRFS